VDGARPARDSGNGPAEGPGPAGGQGPSGGPDPGAWPAPPLLRYASGWVVRVLVVTAGLVLLALFLLFFFAKDGPGMWRWVVGLFARPFREPADAVGREAWSALRYWVLGTTVVALLDATGIGIALLLIGVPLVVLTFLAAYVPVAGAVVAVRLPRSSRWSPAGRPTPS
jgi:predicted PurR-regulated permease PerM